MNIVLVISSGWGVRVFLQTSILAELLKSGNVYLIAYGGILNGLDNEEFKYTASAALLPFNIQPGKYEGIYQKRNFIFNRISPTTTRKIKEGQYLNSIPFSKRLKVFIKKNWNALTLSNNQYEAFLHEESDRFSIEYPELENYYRNLFGQWQPDLVLVTTPHIKEEIPPVLTATKMGIKTGAWINSWDNLTSKAAYRAPFDGYFLWSDYLAKQLQQYYPEAKEKAIFATGVPHFDWYSSPKYHLTREAYCTRYQLHNEARILLYAACTPHLFPEEHLLVERLIKEGQQLLPSTRIQWIVRLHPGDSGNRFKNLLGRSDVWLQVPNPSGALESFFPSFDDNLAQVNSIRYADVVINSASTISIDAAINDVPSINIAFTIGGTKQQEDIIRNYYRYDHFKTVIDLNATRVVYTYEALISMVEAYISDKAIDKEGRSAVVKLWCGNVDGKSAERVVLAVRNFLKS